MTIASRPTVLLIDDEPLLARAIAGDAPVAEVHDHTSFMLPRAPTPGTGTRSACMSWAALHTGRPKRYCERAASLCNLTPFAPKLGTAHPLHDAEGCMKTGAQSHGFRACLRAWEGMTRLHGKIVIFVVDDDAVLRRALNRVLRDPSYAVCCFENPLDALARIDELSPALIVSDNSMAKMTGFDFLREVRAERPAIRTLMVTGGCIGEKIRASLAAGEIDALIEKPWVDDVLRARVRELLDRERHPVSRLCSDRPITGKGMSPASPRRSESAAATTHPRGRQRDDATSQDGSLHRGR